MRKPAAFGGYTGVFNRAMFVIISLYVSVGACGYLKYGSEVEGSITINLPKQNKWVAHMWIAQSVLKFEWKYSHTLSQFSGNNYTPACGLCEFTDWRKRWRSCSRWPFSSRTRCRPTSRWTSFGTTTSTPNLRRTPSSSTLSWACALFWSWSLVSRFFNNIKFASLNYRCMSSKLNLSTFNRSQRPKAP